MNRLLQNERRGHTDLSGISEKMSQVLSARPPRQTAIVYQSIILGIALHIFVLLILFFSTSSPESGVESEPVEAVEEFDLQFAEEEELENEQLNPESSKEEIRNLLSNARSDRTSAGVNYTGKSQSEIEAEVLENLKGLEAQEFDRLKSGRSEVKEDIPLPADPKNKDQKTTTRENYDWFKNQSDKSFAGPVSAEYDLAGRSTRQTPRPTYRCQASGQVVVRIEVDQSGNVISAEIDESRTTGSDCIRDESLGYARKWKFDYSTSAPKKQNGTIVFTFARQ